MLLKLQEAQQRFGYVPATFMAETAAELQVPLSEVYGVASFYSFLSVQPLGRNVIRVCGSVPCCMKDSQLIIDCIQREIGIAPGQTTADGRFTLELTNCIGACDVAPAMLVNENLHGALTPGTIASVLANYR